MEISATSALGEPIVVPAEGAVNADELACLRLNSANAPTMEDEELPLLGGSTDATDDPNQQHLTVI